MAKNEWWYSEDKCQCNGSLAQTTDTEREVSTVYCTCKLQIVPKNDRTLLNTFWILFDLIPGPVYWRQSVSKLVRQDKHETMFLIFYWNEHGPHELFYYFM